MSISVETNVTLADRHHLAELSAERDRLQADLAKAQSEREAYAKAWIKLQCTDDILQYTNEEILADLGREPSLRDLIAQLESGA